MEALEDLGFMFWWDEKDRAVIMEISSSADFPTITCKLAPDVWRQFYEAIEKINAVAQAT